MGVLALDKASTVHELCPGKQCRDQSGIDEADAGKRLVVGSTIALSVGAVGLGIGIYALTRPDTPAHTGAVRSTPAGAAIVYGAAF